MFNPMRRLEPCRKVRDMNRRSDPIFDERPDSFPGIAGAMHLQSLLNGGEDCLRLPEDPE